MKKIIIPCLIGVIATACLAGCSIELGTGTTTKVYPATVGEQLVDLKRARDNGAINEQEYETQRSKILNARQ